MKIENIEGEINSLREKKQSLPLQSKHNIPLTNEITPSSKRNPTSN
jgi:hypothetical protein